MKNVNNSKTSASGCCLIFCKFHAGVAYKSVACKKKRVLRKN